MDARNPRVVQEENPSPTIGAPDIVAPSPETGVVVLADAARAPQVPRTGWREIFRRLMRTRTGRIGFALMTFYVVAALLGPIVAPYSSTEMDFLHRLERPSTTHLFGTDQFGRDILSRVLVGTRYILPLAIAATAVGVSGGVIVGMTAGYYGHRVDEITMRIVDGLMSFPSLVLALLIVSVFGSSFGTLLLAIGVVFIPRVARIVRSATLDVKNREFVEAARLRGESATYIIFREILPNVSAPVTVESAIRMSYAILLTASLSFLGLGAQPPTPDWGLMVAQSREFIHDAPWTILFPAMAISGLVIAANLLADGIREVLSYSGEEAQS
jgi:peptide/nickel transport system permease protein